MRRLVVVGAVAAVVAWAAVASSAGGEEAGTAAGAAAPVFVTVRLIRTEGPADFLLRPGETRFAGEDADELLRRLSNVAGPEAVVTWAVPAEGSAEPQRLSLLERVPLLRDYDVGEEVGDLPVLRPVRGTIPEGVITDFRSRRVPAVPAVALEIRARIAALVRPMKTFDARISSGGPPRIVDLPELNVTSYASEIQIPVGFRGFVSLDFHNLLAIDVTAELPRDPFDRSVREPR